MVVTCCTRIIPISEMQEVDEISGGSSNLTNIIAIVVAVATVVAVVTAIIIVAVCILRRTRVYKSMHIGSGISKSINVECTCILVKHSPSPQI